MNNLEMKTRIALNLANMQTGHPHYGEIQAALNDAVRELPKMVVSKSVRNLNLFPELTRRARAITVANEATLNLPIQNMLIPLKMYTFQKATAPDDNRDRTWPVRYVDPEVYEYLSKDTNTTGWPRLWTRIGNDAKIWPTPSTAYVTYNRMYYIMKEEDMSADLDQPTIDEQWHRALTDLASYYMEIGMQRPQRAGLWLAAAQQKIAGIVNIVSLTEGETNHELVAQDAIDMGLVQGPIGGLY